MPNIPVPEIVVVLVVAVVTLIVRMVSRLARRQEARVDTEQVRARLLASCILVAIISIPLIVGVVPPNGIYGFRTHLTQSSRAIWYPANAFMGWALVVAAAISGTSLALIAATAKRWMLWATFYVPLSGAIVASFVYLQRLG